MKEQITKKIVNGIIYVHILHHGVIDEFYGSWMMEELQNHGYHVSPGTLYPILKSLVTANLLTKENRNVNGKIRKYYRTTNSGKELLEELKGNLKELFHDLPK